MATKTNHKGSRIHLTIAVEAISGLYHLVGVPCVDTADCSDIRDYKGCQNSKPAII